ncbi:MAG TPA: pilus assembly protein TadG-related protein [Ktedonobacterales bacterium]|nr:pilus assembly protein TadG-related protein [Ktedonobacterales bacterium]
MRYRFPLRHAARSRRGQRGQTLVIMAFLATFMIVLLGLVVDSVRLYVLTAQAERTAEAAALAGALYMPDYFSTPAPAPDGQDALSRVCDLAKQNGITNCQAAPGTVGILAETVTGNQYELQVTVTLQADVFFLNFVSPNLSTATVSRSATAQFLPPIALGSRAAAFGDQADIDATTGQSVQSFLGRLNGPSSLQSNGDAFTPVLQEGPTDPITYPDGGSYHFSRWTPAPACPPNCTNHQQYGQCTNCPPGPIANPDQHQAGFTGADGGSGYNYEIVVPPGVGDVQVQIFNPIFDPDNQQGSNSNGHDDMGSACLDPIFSTGGCKTDKQNEYLQLSYSLYSAPVFFERDTDTLLTTFSPASVDNIGADNSAHGCNGGTPYWDPQQQKCVADPGYIEKWYTLYTITQPGNYRLVVEPEASNPAAPSSSGYGEHEYGLKLTDAASATTCTLGPPSASSGSTICPATDGPRIWAWNDMCVYFIANGNSTFDLGEIPAAYAGKTLNFSLYDPGDGSDVKMAILDPSGNKVALPNWVRTVGGSGGTQILASQSGDSIYNGLWLHLPITIPSGYNPTPGSDWWQVQYTGSAVNDTITISISLSGSPIHLVSEVF